MTVSVNNLIKCHDVDQAFLNLYEMPPNPNTETRKFFIKKIFTLAVSVSTKESSNEKEVSTAVVSHRSVTQCRE
jgi:hypothetical protein